MCIHNYFQTQLLGKLSGAQADHVCVYTQLLSDTRPHRLYPYTTTNKNFQTHNYTISMHAQLLQLQITLTQVLLNISDPPYSFSLLD